MDENVKNFVSIASKTLKVVEPIYEFGALQVPGQEGFADLRPLFPGFKYVGADVRKGPGVDMLLDLHNIELPAESVGTIICVDTLEHVEYPHRSLEEMHRILKQNGIAIISSVMNWPIHNYPSDYWRFTPEAFRSLLKPFEDAFVGYAGQDEFPRYIVGIGFKGRPPDISEFIAAYENWRSNLISEHPARDFVKSLIPSALLPIVRPVYRRLMAILAT